MDVCIRAGAAVKEEQIETKLASIQADWATINLVFADCKTRGPVILKSSDTADLIEKLEDSQVGLALLHMPVRALACLTVSKPKHAGQPKKN
jgi:hypothetical protein